MPKFKITKKISFQEYIIFSSALAVFMQGMYTRDFIIDLKLFYLVIGLNTFLLYVKYNLKIHKYMLFMLFFLIVHAVITNTAYTIPWILWIKQIIGISFVAIYYYNIFIFFDPKKLFNTYLKLSIFFCVLAIILFQFGFLLQSTKRLDGLMSEPSAYVYVNIPALYFFIKAKKWFPAILLFFSFILAQSSIGFITIILVFLFLIVRKNSIKYIGLTIIPLFILIPYVQNNKHFKSRYESIVENLKVYQTNKIGEAVNISSFVLLKSSYIAYKNFLNHPLGTGIGSFEHQHDIYIKRLDMPWFIHKLKAYELNKFDANSLFLRGLSDFGIFWLFFVLFVCWLGFYANSINYIDDIKKTICISAFIYILIYLIRGGHYFPEEMYFFVFMFVFNLPKFNYRLKN